MRGRIPHYASTYSSIQISRVATVFAFPPMLTRSFLNSQASIPPLLEICLACIVRFPNLDDQNGINEQCAEPVTGSSKNVACGVKNLETKSQSLPGAVTMTPPGSKFI